MRSRSERKPGACRAGHLLSGTANPNRRLSARRSSVARTVADLLPERRDVRDPWHELDGSRPQRSNEDRDRDNPANGVGDRGRRGRAEAAIGWDQDDIEGEHHDESDGDSTGPADGHPLRGERVREKVDGGNAESAEREHAQVVYGADEPGAEDDAAKKRRQDDQSYRRDAAEENGNPEGAGRATRCVFC